ncbi:MAG: sigma-70 family RNA polymerase sigma factor [Bdellovibrionales bacterium]|nr:sigma-70 family RNA polymerase sigma factor [Bdellovibrionales bacterium]
MERSIAELADNVLVDEFQNGHIPSFEELVKRYREKAFHLAMRITRNQDDAEEILQDVFTSVFHKISAFERKSAFSSWLYRITVNTAFMKLRNRRKHAAMCLEDIQVGSQQSWTTQRSDTSDVNYISARHELKKRIQVAIDSLPDEYKTIFILRDVDGMSNQEASEVLDISIPAVKSRLHRARMLLRKKLEEYHEDYVSNEHIAYGPYVGFTAATRLNH